MICSLAGKFFGRASLLASRGSAGGSTSLIVLVAIVLIAGCKRDEMADQPKARTYRGTEFFADGSTARPVVAGTIARGQLAAYTEHAAGTAAQDAITAFPFPLTYDDLKRGQERFDIYCAVCHGRTGEGNGMIVQRGFTRPPAYFPLAEHSTQAPDLYAREQALLTTTPGHIVNVITNGYGAMYNYADRVNSDDRWRIAGYIKALQLSRTIKLADLPPADRAQLEKSTNPTTHSTVTPTNTEGAPR